MGFEAVFENGSLTFDSNTEPSLSLTKNDQSPEAIIVEQPGPKDSFSSGNISALGGYYNELEYFTNCLLTDNAPEIATIAQASESIRVLCAELRSAQSGKSVTF
jgi:hypothetical protein